MPAPARRRLGRERSPVARDAVEEPESAAAHGRALSWPERAALDPRGRIPMIYGPPSARATPRLPRRHRRVATSPKTHALLIRLAPEDRVRLQRIAEANFLETSTWARQVLLRAADEAERPAAPPRRASRKRAR